MSELDPSPIDFYRMFPDSSGELGQPAYGQGPHRWGDPNTALSPVDKWVLNPNQLIEGGRGALTSSYENHALGIGRERSGAPGIDTDVSDRATEGLSLGQRPRLISPVDGTVTMVKQDPWGTTKIVDRNGWTHTFVHGSVAGPAPSGRPYFLQEGGKVRQGDPRGYLFNEGTLKDHDHYYLQDPQGRFHDPMNVYRSKFDGAIEGIIDPHLDNQIWQERMFLEELETPGPGYNYDDRWDNLLNMV